MPDIFQKGDNLVRGVNTKDHDLSGKFVDNSTKLRDSKYYAMASAILNLRRKRRLIYLEQGLDVPDQEEEDVGS